MQRIVADTTPLNYLVLIQAVEILPALYGNVIIPPAVRDELPQTGAPEIVREWISQRPIWLEIVHSRPAEDLDLSRLDAGEREAIALASELSSGLLLMDERDGVIAARRKGLNVVGTLGSLDLAASRGLLELQTMFDRLRKTSFRLPVGLMASMLEQDANRRNQH
jgi:predicted nucleic acid-binding protein